MDLLLTELMSHVLRDEGQASKKTPFYFDTLLCAYFVCLLRSISMVFWLVMTPDVLAYLWTSLCINAKPEEPILQSQLDQRILEGAK